MCIAVVCLPVCDVIDFEIYLIYLIKSFLLMTKNSVQKFKYLENEKSFWSKIKAFSSFLKGFQLLKVVSDLRVIFKGNVPTLEKRCLLLVRLCGLCNESYYGESMKHVDIRSREYIGVSLFLERSSNHHTTALFGNIYSTVLF